MYDKLAAFRAEAIADSMPRMPQSVFGGNRGMLRAIMDADDSSDNVFFGVRWSSDVTLTAKSQSRLRLINQYDRLAVKYRRRGEHRKAARYERKSQATDAVPHDYRPTYHQETCRVFCRTKLDEAWLCRSLTSKCEIQCGCGLSIVNVRIIARSHLPAAYKAVRDENSSLVLCKYYQYEFEKHARDLFEKIHAITPDVSLRFHRLADSEAITGGAIAGVVDTDDGIFPAIVLEHYAVPLVAILKRWRFPNDGNFIPIVGHHREAWGHRDMQQLQLLSEQRPMSLATCNLPASLDTRQPQTYERKQWRVPRFRRGNQWGQSDCTVFVSDAMQTIEPTSAIDLILSALAVATTYCHIQRFFSRNASSIQGNVAAAKQATTSNDVIGGSR